MDIFSSGPSDKDAGNQVLKAYFDEASKFPEFGFGDYDSWVTWLNQTFNGDFVSFIGNLVNMNYASESVSQAADQLTYLANASGGQATIPQITQNAGGSGDTVNYAAAIPEVASGAASTLVSTAENVGQGIISTGKMIKYLPWILGIGAAIYLYSSGKGTGSALKSFLKKNPKRKNPILEL